jgi:hypothetical protein
LTLARAGFVDVPPGAAPGFDHADVHRGHRLVYVAHTGADRLDVLDADGLRFLRSLEGLPGVAGVLVDEEHDLLFTSDRGAARVSLFRCSDERLLGRVEVGPHPNGLAYDRRRRRLYAFNLGDPPGEGSSASVVDVDAQAVVAELPLPGRPRWAVYDEVRDRVFVNIRRPAQILVLDSEPPAAGDAFAVPSDGPHGLGLERGRLWCAADGGELVGLDKRSGAVLARLPLPGVPDVVMCDGERRRLYVAVGEPGVVCSFDTARPAPLETVATEAGAHTLAWDPVARRLWAFCPGSGGALVLQEHD